MSIAYLPLKMPHMFQTMCNITNLSLISTSTTESIDVKKIKETSVSRVEIKEEHSECHNCSCPCHEFHLQFVAMNGCRHFILSPSKVKWETR